MTWADSSISEANCHGVITIDDVDMNRAAWAVLNPWVLWNPAKKRGDDNLIPGVGGVLPNRRRKTVTTHTLELLIIGTCDENGDPVPPDEWQMQLARNSEYLDVNVFDDPVTVDGTRTLVLTLPDGSTRTGAVHILDSEYGVTVPPAITCALDISIPGGQLGPITPPVGS